MTRTISPDQAGSGRLRPVEMVTVRDELGRYDRMTDHTKPSKETRDAEAQQAGQAHQPDRMPTDDESRLADNHKLSAGVSEHEKEMAERGANQKGEGRV